MTFPLNPLRLSGLEHMTVLYTHIQGQDLPEKRCCMRSRSQVLCTCMTVQYDAYSTDQSGYGLVVALLLTASVDSYSTQPPVLIVRKPHFPYTHTAYHTLAHLGIVFFWAK